MEVYINPTAIKQMKQRITTELNESITNIK